MTIIRTPEGKTCTKCLEFKLYTSYHRSSTVKDGHKPVCKECTKLYREANKDLIKEGKKKYYKANKEKVLADNKEYYNANKEKLANWQKEYNEKNKEHVTQRRKEHYQRNKEKIDKKNKAYAQANREKISTLSKERYLANRSKLLKRSKENGKIYRKTARGRELAHIRSVKRRSLKYKVDFTPYERNQLLERDNWTCQNCNIKVHDRSGGNWNTPNKAHIDHIVPISKGGNSDPDNLQVLCRTCNLSKGKTH